MIDGLDMTIYEAMPTGTECIGTIAVVTRDLLSAPTAMSMMGIDSAIQKMASPGQYVKKFIIVGQILTFQRNECIHHMEGDWLLFIDSDMAWSPKDLVTLLEDQKKWDLDIVGGLCFQRLPPYQPTLYMLAPDDPNAYIYLEDWQEDAAVEVDATGMAFSLIHRRVFDRIVQRQGGFSFPSFEERRNYKPIPFFRWEFQWGEDFLFCREAKASGSRIYVDTGVKPTHMGYIPIDQNTFFKEIAHRDPATEEFKEGILSQLDSRALTRAEATQRLDGGV